MKIVGLGFARAALEDAHQAGHGTVEKRHAVEHCCAAAAKLTRKLDQRVFAYLSTLSVDEQEDAFHRADVGQARRLPLLSLVAQLDPGAFPESGHQARVLVVHQFAGDLASARARCIRQVDLLDLDLTASERVFDDRLGEAWGRCDRLDVLVRSAGLATRDL